jgi:hypothetical protein
VSVWVQEWQFACCGGPFAVGDTVTWTISPAVPGALAAYLGEDRAAALAGVEDHHDALPDPAPVAGRIVEILTDGDDGRVVHVHRSDQRRPGGGPLAGWLVRIDVEPAAG